MPGNPAIPHPTLWEQNTIDLNRTETGTWSNNERIFDKAVAVDVCGNHRHDVLCARQAHGSAHLREDKATFVEATEVAEFHRVTHELEERVGRRPANFDRCATIGLLANGIAEECDVRLLTEGEEECRW